jgi:hypothetical protein
MKKLIFFALLYLGSVGLEALAQEQPELDVILEIRPRTELRNGAFRLRAPGDDPSFFTSQRSRLSLDYRMSRVSLGFGVQNIRVWGASPQIAVNEGNNTMIHEAWAAYQFSPEWSVKFGRQSLIYDDDRILGSLDWHQAGRWHDVLLLRYEPENWKIHLGAGYNQDTEQILGNYYSAPGNHYKSLQMLWAGHTFNEKNKFSVLLLNTGFESPVDSAQNFMQTIGANFYRTNSPANFTASFYYQLGQNPAGADVNAFLAAVYGNFRLSDQFSLLAGTDFLSGNDLNDSDPGETRVFNPLYGTHHKFYGFMDYFYVGNPHMNVGLWDKYFGISGKFSKDFSMQLTGHYFDSAGEIYRANESNNLQSYLGTELDLTFNWVISPVFKLVGGYSQMLATESMEVIKGGDSDAFQSWTWLMLTANPTIFSMGE